MSELNLRQIRYVVAMADAGSISAAARVLQVSQPTLSSSLRELEQSLGIALFVRSPGRPLTATAEGRVLLPEIRRLAAHADDVAQRASGLAAPATGTVRLGSLVTVAPVVVPPLIREFRSDQPDAAVAVSTADQQALLEGLRTGDLHMALTYDLDIDEGVDFVPIAAVAPKVLLPSAHPLAGRRSLKLSALAGEPFVLLDLPVSSDYFQAVFLAAGVSMRPAMRCSDLSFVRGLVAEHLGYSVVNLVPSQRGDDGLAYVSIDGPVPHLQLGLAMADRPLPAAAQEFAALVRARLPKLLTTRTGRRG
ncbi:MAG: LysR family transcriptional regulator [Ilumatobacteraceae bacterium]|nr:LysR family transcriptional regulator [Ilumatobacteraceae bacterium]